VWGYQWRWCGANWWYVSWALALINNPSICYAKTEAVRLKAGAVANYQVVLGNIGNVYLYRTEFPTAISYYQRALAIAREIKDPLSIRSGPTTPILLT
jgi:protein gp37